MLETRAGWWWLRVAGRGVNRRVRVGCRFEDMHTRHVHHGWMVESVFWMTEVPGGQRFSDENFIQASDGEQARLGEALV